MELTIDEFFAPLQMPMHIGIMDYDVNVRDSAQELVLAMEEGAKIRMEEMLGQPASSDPVVASVRELFKETGKDPSRYRPSSEALLRRVLSGKGLYQVNNVVDSGNLTSLMTSVPIGCYDADQIFGDMTLRVGFMDESYEGIGRGDVNLAGLPILCDEKGPFGSPFSDSMRTAVTENTKTLFFVIYGINVDIAHVEAASEMADTLITTFCSKT